METSINRDVLIKAIGIRFCECFGALSVASIFGGPPSDVWIVIDRCSAQELISEAEKAGINLDNVKVIAPKNQPLKESFAFKTLYPISSEEQYEAFVKWEAEMTAAIKNKHPQWELYYRDVRTLRRRIWEYKSKLSTIKQPY